ncbi:MAG: hypothetical protein ACXQTQ_00045 [Candidatus Hecatellaceae archaeon]
MPTHFQCEHFKEGYCTLLGTPINPNTPTCPNFTPKREEAKPGGYPGREPPPPLRWQSFYQLNGFHPPPQPVFNMGYRRRFRRHGRFRP